MRARVSSRPARRTASRCRLVQPYSIRPAALFHALTPLYDFGCELLGFGSDFKGWLVDEARVAPEHRVLDVGCGTGVLLRELARRFPGLAIDAVDPDPRALSLARAKLADWTLSAEFQVARGEDLPFGSATFDRVFCSLALHHVPDPWKLAVLGEVRRVLKPRGTFLCADFDNRARWWVPHGFRSERSLQDWLALAGFAAEPVARRRLVHVYRCSPRV